MKGQNLENFNLDFYNFFASVAKDLNCTIKSLCNNYIFEVFSIDKNKKFYITGNSLPLNNNSAQKICSDKVATSTILAKNGIDCVEHILLKNPKILKNWKDQIFDELLKIESFQFLKYFGFLSKTLSTQSILFIAKTWLVANLSKHIFCATLLFNGNELFIM